MMLEMDQINWQTCSNCCFKLLFVCLCLSSFSLWMLFNHESILYRHFIPPKTIDSVNKSGYLVNGPGCQIPDFHMYTREISLALEEENTEAGLDCILKPRHIYVKSNLTHLYIDEAEIENNDLRPEEVQCCFRPFWSLGLTLLNSVKSQSHEYSKNCYRFGIEGVQVKNKYVRVECKIKGTLSYIDFFYFLPHKYQTEGQSVTPGNNLSVLVVGIDSMSRLNFRRQMKQTHFYLTKEIGFLEFFGYNKVGCNTFANLIPLLTGNNSLVYDGIGYFDKVPFIWKEFKKLGFITGFGEDSSGIGVFEYAGKGFENDPTDVYLRFFDYVYEKELAPDSHKFVIPCVAHKLTIEILLDAVEKFVINLKNKLSFGFFWQNSLSHEDLNQPKYGDTTNMIFFKKLEKEKIFETHVVIVMSDHGMRFGKIRKTYQGFYEDRLPLLMISLPAWFQNKYPLAWANLNTNRQRLVSPYDLHQTLRDFLNVPLLKDKIIEERTSNLKPKQRGVSLFLPLSLKRICTDAGIDNQWCACHHTTSVLTTNSIIINGAKLIIDHINNLLIDYNNCKKLTVNQIVKARMRHATNMSKANCNKNDDSCENDKIFFRDKVMKEDYYTITLLASPGDGMFEATLRHDVEADSFSLSGSVARINLYRNTSYCVSNSRLKLYCYCA